MNVGRSHQKLPTAVPKSLFRRAMSWPRMAYTTSSSNANNPTGSKRTRNVGPKSHEGCKVCKKRHLKCDEAKPHCRRCTRSGWECNYDTRPIHLNRPLKPVQPKTPAVNPPQTQISLAPSVDIPGTPEQRRSFHYFRSRNVSALPGSFEPYFWSSLMLQLCHRFPTTRQSLFALSAMYEEHSHSPGKAYNRQSYSEGALRQYNTAIKSLVQYLSSPHPDPRVTLVSCLIFVWIEFLQARTDLAFAQVQSGVKIIREMQNNPKHNRKQWFIANAEDLMGSLNRSFTRLKIQAAVHGAPIRDNDDVSVPVSSKVLDLEPIPERFASTFESRIYLDRELNALWNFIREIQNIMQQPEEQVQAFATRQILLQRLSAWHVADAAIQETIINAAAKAYLQMYYIVGKIALEVQFINSEMVYDHYTAGFERILQLAGQLVEPSHTEQPVLSFDIRVVMKCRVLRLRRKAIALLKMAPGQEGMWSRDTMLKYCIWKVTLEEQSRGSLSEDDFLPEEARAPVPYPHGIKTVSGKPQAHESVGGTQWANLYAHGTTGEKGCVPEGIVRVDWPAPPKGPNVLEVQMPTMKTSQPGFQPDPELLKLFGVSTSPKTDQGLNGEEGESMDEFINRLLAPQVAAQFTAESQEELDAFIAQLTATGDISTASSSAGPSSTYVARRPEERFASMALDEDTHVD